MPSTLNDRLAERLRQIRVARGWSLEVLAEKSSVSRSTLSRIENGEVSPTAETLGSLSSVYQMSISQLLAPVETPFQPLVRRADQTEWHDTENGFSRRIVSPPSGGLSAEVVGCTLAANQRISYAAPSVPGHEHHLVLLSGILAVTIGDETKVLEAGDCLRYQLFGPSRFQTGDQPATYLIVLV
ncbi:MAG: XRE family transcriptional regulator [Hoeflea sp.]|uniref:helix-turn-helix domain-containing protein n=1 Tax=Hoeflea sp. TaxID=1940281 RepID=UPI00272FEB8A|nr:XRE family transcriptional regulator [Hoeflea sp.]MDP2121233.1 XRE family transcriptional regulator [Hoeflea sp.]MDZ7603180.1 XRE family transcriptional regulator [Hoeflea sp.]